MKAWGFLVAGSFSGAYFTTIAAMRGAPAAPPPWARSLPDIGMQKAPRPATDAMMLERCRAAGRVARCAGVARQDNPFSRLLLPARVGETPYEVWTARSDAWLAGWDGTAGA